MDDENSAKVPSSMRNLRACLHCSMIKTMDQFYREGCDNCEEIMELQGDRQRVLDCTTLSFEGMISMMVPQESWVARWQRIVTRKPGCYAIKAHGSLPDYVNDELRKQDS